MPNTGRFTKHVNPNCLQATDLLTYFLTTEDVTTGVYQFTWVLGRIHKHTRTRVVLTLATHGTGKRDPGAGR